ncbi:MAG: ATP-binding protein [Desulfobacterales bacterium]|jgi:signal transduction histidine kinase
MSIISNLENLRPLFLKGEINEARQFRYLFNYPRLWQVAIMLMATVAIVPLICLTIFDYRVTQHAVKAEILLRTSRLASNTKRSIAFYLEARKSALDFIVHDNDPRALQDNDRLKEILADLDSGFGGFVDLGVIDAHGRQVTYVGPYRLEGKDYSPQDWFQEVKEQGIHISDVFLGYRKLPHLVIAVKYPLAEGSFYVLRATIDTERFNRILSELEVSAAGDAFLINRDGIIQTPTSSSGNVFEKSMLVVPPYSEHTQVYETQTPEGIPLIIGYAYIPSTSFILLIVKKTEQVMQAWYATRFEFISFLVVSVAIILIVILAVATYLVNSVYLTDRKRLMTLHAQEYASKLASIGRLAAGVAHEINNPLAIINEKAGLINDLLQMKDATRNGARLVTETDAIISSVQRCGTITKRLLSFARHMDVSLEHISLKELVEEVLGFLGKEAEYRCIDVKVDISEEIPNLYTDRGKLQQIFLNIINNAFAAMKDGGQLSITAVQEEFGKVAVSVRDTGCGISASDLKQIYEPFFSTKTSTEGTGLGLSITYGLVSEIGGKIEVESQVDVGTCFTIKLPQRIDEKEEKITCASYS